MRSHPLEALATAYFVTTSSLYLSDTFFFLHEMFLGLLSTESHGIFKDNHLMVLNSYTAVFIMNHDLI